MGNYYFKICVIALALFLLSPTTRAQQPDTAANQTAQLRPGWSSGFILDDYNVPLSGVTVSIKGSNAPAVKSNEQGRFDIQAAPGAVLLFQYPNFYVKEITVRGSEQLTVKLTPSFLKSPDNIDVLYGTANRSSVLGSISSIYTNQLSTTPASLYVYAFPGQLAGLYTQQTRGFTSFNVSAISSAAVIGQTLVNPGSNNNRSTDNTEFNISVRGQTPITVIDGVQREISSLDPESIESVSILKDGLSTILLGINSSKPVILVTTKHGEAGKPRIGFTAEYGLQQSLSLPKPLSAYQYAYLLNETLTSDGKLPAYNAADFAAYRNHTDPYGHPDVNWFKTILRDKSPISSYKLNISGGTNIARYSVALGYFNQSGIFRTSPSVTYNTNNDLSRYIINSDLSVQVTKNLNVNLQLFGRVQTTTEPGSDYTSILNSLYSTPNNAYPIYNPNGSFGGSNIGGNTGPYSNNLLAQAQFSGYTQNHTNDILANLDLNYNLSSITKGLTAKIQGNLAYQSITAINRSLQNATYRLNADSSYNVLGSTVAQNNAFTTAYTSRQSYGQASLNYNRQFGQHNVGAQLLYDVKSVVANYDLPSNTQNIAGKITYNYAGKYFVEAAVNRSGNNRLPPGDQFGTFYAAGLGWQMGAESFIKENLPWISSWKWRATYARTGNNSLELTPSLYYAYRQTYGSSNVSKAYSVGSAYTTVFYQYESILANPYIRWESADKLDIGTDIGVLNDHLQISADYYHDKYFNLLGTRGNTVALLGTAYPLENIGRNLYHGEELTVTYKNHVNNFNYFVTANGSVAYSKILFNDELATPYPYNARTGLPVSGTYYGYISEGLYQTAQDAAASPHIAGYNPQPGDIKYRDLNGDGIINSFDQTTIGGRKPLVFYGLTLGANYKGFNFSVIIQGVKNRMINVENNTIDQLGLDNSTLNGQAYESATGRWTPETASTATLPRLGVAGTTNNALFSTFYLKSGDYVRLKNAEIGYSLPYSMLSRLRVAGLRIFINAQNIVTIAGFKGLDPEVFPNNYPIQRVFNAGVSLKL